MSRRYAAKVDTNQKPIVKALKDIFGEDVVFDLSAVGRGCPDIMVGVRGVNLLFEIKTDSGTLTTDQKIFHQVWTGQVNVIRNLDDALQIIAKHTA